jgi:hypothetical protein
VLLHISQRCTKTDGTYGECTVSVRCQATPEVPINQPAQNAAENPTNQNADQPVVAPDIIQMGNVVAPEPAIKKRHIEENSDRTAGLFNMAKVVQLTKGNISFENC